LQAIHQEQNYMSEQSTTPPPTKLPPHYVKFQKSYPEVFNAYDALGNVLQEAGPLDGKTRALVKLALAVGGRLEGAVHSHARRAREAGCTPEEIRHVVVLGMTTLGFPSTMATLSWVDDVLAQTRAE
jgi:4-carboxymuconolactone decarboxylase